MKKNMIAEILDIDDDDMMIDDIQRGDRSMETLTHLKV